MIILKFLRYILLCAIILFPQKDLLAYDKNGEYIVGGGVGSVSCSQYISLLAQAQLAGGINSLEGANMVNPYMSYIVGFQTGYNVSHQGKKDIFADIGGASPTSKALFLIEDWCKKNPDKRFGAAVITLADNLNKH